ncbi:MAG: ribonuclease E/G [Tissierellia bacterium]|nr:ribonuclease E/G [Tissierellia bacterium]
MDKFAFIHIFQGKKMIAVIENKKIIAHESFSDQVSSIYRVRVEKYIKSLDAYIVDLGLEKKGLLRKRNAHKDRKANDQAIVELIHEGQGQKLYEVSEKFSITDGFLVLKNNIYKDHKYDIYLRSRASGIDEPSLKRKEEVLAEIFYELKRQINFYPTPKMLRKNTRLKEFVDNFDGPVYNNIEGINIESSIKDQAFTSKYNVDISRALYEIESRLVSFDNGLELVFDRTEACYVIDINTGAFRTDLAKDKLSYLANYEVLDDLARLISVKNLKKMLVIDFIRMTTNEEKLTLISEFKRKLSKYKVKYQIFGFTKMGLFEMIIQ